MPLTPNFTTSQNAANLSIAVITDTSTGSYTGIDNRRVYFKKYDGTYLVPNGNINNYVSWPIVNGIGDVLNVDILDKDYCLDIKVEYLNSGTVITSKTILCLFTGYTDVFLRELTRALAANRVPINSANYWQNKYKLRTLLEDAKQGVAMLNDQTIATFCLDEAKKITDNIAIFF